MFKQLLRTACVMLMVSLWPLGAMALPHDGSVGISFDGIEGTDDASDVSSTNGFAAITTGSTGTGSFKVEEVLPDSVVLSAHAVTLRSGERFQLTAKVFPDDVSRGTIRWMSSDSTVAHVSPSGLVSAFTRGTCMIYAKCGEQENEKSDSCLVTVIESEVFPESVELSSHSETLFEGDRLQLTAKVYPEDVTNGEIFWKSTNEAVAHVAPNGYVTALSPGTTQIVAICQDKSDTCLITVKAHPVPPESVVLSSHAETLQVDGTVQLTATVYPANVTDPSIVWTTSDASVATVDETGLVTAVAPGSCVITATCQDKSDACTITVEAPVVLPDSVVLSSHAETLQVDGTVQLTATVYPANVTDPSIVWTTSDASVATVDETGLVTAVAPGTCVITATCQDKSDACTITVEAPVILPDSVVLSSHAETLQIEGTVQLTATVYPTDVTDPSIVWTTSDASVATVDETGLVTAVAPGTCVITATCQDKSDACTITVEAPVILPDSVVLSSHAETLQIEGTVQLTATVYPADVTDPSIVWTTSDASVATVDETGLVTAVAPGTCVITATCQDKSDACTITVEAPVVLPDSVVLSSHAETLQIEGTVQLTATVYPADVTDPSIVWTTSDASVATVDETGLVTAVAPGTCVITATCQDKSDACTITVEAPVVLPDSVVLSSHAETLQIEGTVQLTATVYPADVTDPSIVWTTSDASVATVDEAGLVTAVAPGTCVITATCQDKSDACTITVEAPVVLPDSVVLSSHAETLQIEGTVQLTATVYPADVTDPSIVWTTSDASVATVDEAGLVTAVAPGTCVITATCQDKSDACAITVESLNAQPDSVEMSTSEAKLIIGDDLELTAKAYPESLYGTLAWTWTSSDTNVAKVEDGKVTAIAVGECDILASIGDVKGTCHVIVYCPEDVVITLDQSDANVVINRTVELTPEISPVPRAFVVTSTNEDVAVAMVNDGVVQITGSGYGKATIKVASTDGKAQSDSCSIYVSSYLGDVSGDGSVTIGDITQMIDGILSSNGFLDTYFGDVDIDGMLGISDVTELVDFLLSGKESVYVIFPESVTLSVETASMALGEKLYLDATVEPFDATNKNLIWSSSNTSVAKVSNGVVTATGYGTCDIIAVCRDLMAVCRVEVKQILPESVSLDQENLVLSPGQSVQLTATVKPENTTDKTVTWSSTDTNVATVVNGKVTAKGQGECDIIANCQGLQALCHVKVEVIAPQSITLNMTNAEMGIGDEITLVATVNPENATDKTVEWSSSNQAVATVQNGKVKAVGLGACDIVAKCQNVQATCHVVVKDENVFTVNGVTFVMVPVEAGSFKMGASDIDLSATSYELPQHEVTLTKDYKIGQTEVTQELWEAVLGENTSIFRGNPKRPVENVTWEKCQEFIDSLNKLTGKHFRLPTEAEWEFAARGGNLSQGYKYAGSNTIADVAWFYTNSGKLGPNDPDYGPHEVATKLPNELGLYDMSGNVCEWVNDWYAKYTSDAQVDPTGPATGTYKVYRYGCWNFKASECRIAYRFMQMISHRSEFIGLRLAL